MYNVPVGNNNYQPDRIMNGCYEYSSNKCNEFYGMGCVSFHRRGHGGNPTNNGQSKWNSQ